MTSKKTHVVMGSAFALGMALTPAKGQQGGHGHEHGDHQHGQKASLATALPKCPVTDEPINLAIRVDTDDGPMFFCCKDCISKYQAHPVNYAVKVAAQRKALADRPKSQVICPVSKNPADQDVFVESNGRKVYFCCKGCVNKYRRDPDPYGAALANSYTYQTKCPVMGEAIDPQAFTETPIGTNIYYCCTWCDKKFYQNLHQYVRNLVAQGYRFNPKEMTRGRVHEYAGHDHGSHGHGGHDRDR